MKVSSAVVLALAVGGTAWITHAVLTSRQAGPAGQPAAHDRAASRMLIATSRPAKRSFEQRVQWLGTVQSRVSVELKALADGRVDAIPAGDQAPVEAGQTVMQLGGPQVESEQARLQAGVASLESQLALADETMARLSRDVSDRLATREQLAIAQQSREKINGALQDAQLAMKAFQDRRTIAAPVAGVFTDRRVSVGQTVSAGQTLGEVIDPNRLRIVASLFPPGGAVLKGSSAEVHLAQGQSAAGSVNEVLPEMSPAGATLAWIEGPQIDSQLKPGQTVGGTVTVRTEPSVMAVPTSAIVYDDQEQSYAFVQEDDGYARRSVTLGLAQDGWVQVLSGVKQNELIVTEGAYELYYRDFSRQFKTED